MGYWKPTAKKRDIKAGSNVIGSKITLVFFTGRPRKSQKTDWIMHEFSMNLEAQDSMVVCRVRKNSGSLSNRIPSQSQQSSVPEGPMADESCSKELSSSHNSPPLEQIDSGSESEEEFLNELFQHNSSSHYKDCDDEDCFADIMKDDIIKLDYSLSATTNLDPMVPMNSKDKGKSKEPVGPADHRKKLKQRKRKTCYGEPSELKHPNQEQQRPTCVVSLFSDKMREGKFRRLRCLFLVILALLILFLFLYMYMLGGSRQVKWFTKDALL